MFHFPSFPPHCLCVQQRVTAHDDCRVSPFGHPRITARLTAPRGLSRPPTSFIGSWCQGIHRAPLKTWPQMLASTVQFSSNDQPPTTPDTQPGVHWDRHRRRTSNTRTLRHPTARPTPPAPPRVPRRSSTNRGRSRVCRIVNVPPMSHRHQTFADVPAPDQTKQPGKKCSLERR